MIDFIKLDISLCDPRKLYYHPELEAIWVQERNLKTGDPRSAVFSKIDNIKFKIFPRGDFFDNPYIELSGSLHKYFNIISGLGNHNHNSLTYDDLIYTIYHLYERFSIEPVESYIINAEYGFNIRTWEPPTELISNSFISYKNNPITRLKYFGGRGFYTEHEKSEYNIKVYDKSRQYSLTENILRFEIKTKKRRVINKKGIITLNDLIKRNNLEILIDDLLDKLINFVIVDHVNEEYFQNNSKYVFEYQKATNPNYWSSNATNYYKTNTKSFIHDLNIDTVKQNLYLEAYYEMHKTMLDDV